MNPRAFCFPDRGLGGSIPSPMVNHRKPLLVSSHRVYCDGSAGIVSPRRTANEGTRGGDDHLTPCEVSGASEGSKEKVRCGSLEVFEDREHNRGRKIALKIVVFPATGQDRKLIRSFTFPAVRALRQRKTLFMWRNSLRRFASIAIWCLSTSAAPAVQIRSTASFSNGLICAATGEYFARRRAQVS